MHSARISFEGLEPRALFSGGLAGGLFGGPDPDPVLVDEYEPNNSFAASTNLGTTNNRNIFNLTLHQVTGGDKDFFTFIAPSTGPIGVGIEFSHLDGNLRLDGYTASGQATPTWSSNTSTPANGREGIQIQATAGAQYWIKVSGSNSLVTSHDYSLMINPLSAQFDYSMPSRFGVQRDQWNLPIINNSASYVKPNFVSIDGTLYGRFDTRLDATGTFMGEAISNYNWAISSPLYSTNVSSATASTIVPLPEGTYNVTMTATSVSGTQISTSHSIKVEDHLIVAMGDSYGSGEGNPHQDQQYGLFGIRTDYSHWAQGPDAPTTAAHLRAHRSGWAGIVKMAEQLEASDPRTSVTFLFLDHTGATIPHLINTFQPSGDERETMTDEPQATQLQTITNGRHIDAMYLSIGGNDAGFVEIGGKLVEADPQVDGSAYQGKLDNIFALAAQKIGALSGLYQQLAQRLSSFDVGQIFLNEYPDPTRDSSGGTPAKILDDIINGYELDANEINQVRTKVMLPMMREMAKAAHTHGWSYVSDIASQFATHGYGDWFRTATESIIAQGPLDNITWVSLGIADKTRTTGTLHPNHEGQDVYRWRNFDAYTAADLVTTNFSLSPDAFGSSNGTYTITIRNRGQYTTAGATTAKIFVSTDTSFDGSDLFVTDVPVPAIAPGASVTLTGIVPLRTLPSIPTNNTAYVGAVLDALNQVAESDEVNVPVGASDFVAVRVDRDMTTGFPLAASPTPISLGQTYQRGLGTDELAGQYDSDFFTFNAQAGQTLSFDIDNLASSPNLGTQMQLYTINNDGQPFWILTYNGGGRAPDEGSTANGESYMRHTFTESGTYFLVVTNPNNQQFIDPLNPLFRLPGNQGNYSLTVAPYNTLPAWLSPSPGAQFTLTSSSLTISQGTVTFIGDAATTHPNLNVTVNVNGAAIFNATQHIGELNVDGWASIGTGGNRLVRVSSINVGITGVFDLKDNDLMIDYTGSPLLPTIEHELRIRHIMSGAADLNPRANTTLGAIEARDYRQIYGLSSKFNNEPLDDTIVLIKYTYYGDTDFNGQVNFDDYARMDNGFLLGKTGWLNGDFTRNGMINFDDYALIDLAFNTQGAAL